jgi:hypothetical protein
LKESRNFWAESAQFEKKQFLGSFATASAGLVLIGVGIKTALSGDIVSGIAEVGAGSCIASSFGKMGLNDIKSYVETSSQVAIRQSQIDQLAEREY